MSEGAVSQPYNYVQQIEGVRLINVLKLFEEVYVTVVTVRPLSTAQLCCKWQNFKCFSAVCTVHHARVNVESIADRRQTYCLLVDRYVVSNLPQGSDTQGDGKRLARVGDCFTCCL